MQAFAQDPPRLLPTGFNVALNNLISNKKRMNLAPLFECLNTRHWPVFSDQAGTTTIIGLNPHASHALLWGILRLAAPTEGARRCLSICDFRLAKTASKQGESPRPLNCD